MVWLGYALLGAVAGIFSGLLGIGGAILLIPALVYVFKFSQQQAQGTSIATLLLPIGLLAAWKYYSAGHVNVKAAALMAEKQWDEPLLRDLAQVMRDASICGLGQAAPNPLLSVLERFR